ncbi:SMP-30/gluconolactonase/LRE family protein [Mesohalobacter halotolerans]|jgi:gluconolactonase|uniref:SMP-30/gluconolactonase/LRE family protein n=1 Tax=Mesohalobacter halotolerans TaxID=1883405 RepID=A0A4V6ALL6_9FLAO|nr:SMP-30/gluconolactonase/LRE family protein [Mesohalobacter halotolerans]MBS3738208.1 SMP-30/gluconolactonase/LRE family protein [Psychroflexus sp.]NBC58437.1 SMP-30/gluconolactonase/LRE family protein [Bacteroidota bacterium]TKS57495.1 SMP-30/gluconolactonase/LRE family protein [Mesohalobacter halotolerans]
MKNLVLIGLCISIFACKKEPKQDKNTRQSEFQVKTNSPLKKLASDFKFTEGPAVDSTGNVYFSDIPNSKIWIWTLADSLKLFRENSNGSNGLYFDKNQNLLACEGGASQISLTTPKGDYKIIASEFEGKPFNSTNDLWPDNKGGVYFTDPQYGGDLDNLNQGGMHVFYLHPDHETITKVCSDLNRPNGIFGTPDGKTLYVSDRGAGKTYSYNIEDDGSLSDKTLIIDKGSDGMTLDQEGNIYITTKGKSQVDIFSKSGDLIKTIKIPESPTNVCFGGKERNQLYITAQTSLYRISLNVKGVD